MPKCDLCNKREAELYCKKCGSLYCYSCHKSAGEVKWGAGKCGRCGENGVVRRG